MRIKILLVLMGLIQLKYIKFSQKRVQLILLLLLLRLVNDNVIKIMFLNLVNVQILDTSCHLKQRIVHSVKVIFVKIATFIFSVIRSIFRRMFGFFSIL